jgi:hypothetical protein
MFGSIKAASVGGLFRFSRHARAAIVPLAPN